jgi:hypothetical protein
MIPALIPFTYLPASTARVLNTLMGPVVIYQPSEKAIPDRLSDLAAQRLVEIRTPVTDDSERLDAALAEFTHWARMNPGRTTPGAGFIGARQGEIPFFDDTTINRIRSEIKRYDMPAHQADQAVAVFSARLFLAVAQENDLAGDRLDQDLERFKTMEQAFLESLADADEAGFSRQGIGAGIWQEDPGSRLTEQRIRAWAMLASADAKPPEILVTTSSAVTDTLLERFADKIPFEKLADIRLPLPAEGPSSTLGTVLTDLAAAENLSSAALAPFTALAAQGIDGPYAGVTLFGAADRHPVEVIRRLAPPSFQSPGENGGAGPLRHTLIVRVQIR